VKAARGSSDYTWGTKLTWVVICPVMHAYRIIPLHFLQVCVWCGAQMQWPPFVLRRKHRSYQAHGLVPDTLPHLVHWPVSYPQDDAFRVLFGCLDCPCVNVGAVSGLQNFLHRSQFWRRTCCDIACEGTFTTSQNVGVTGFSMQWSGGLEAMPW